MAPLRSQPDPHDNALRLASAARYSHHRARFPSLTEFPDSPSVYSPYAHHSPGPGLSSPPRPDFDDETASTIRSLSTEDVQVDSDIDDCADDASHRISLRGPKIRFHSRAPWETEDTVSHGQESDKNARSGTIGNKLIRTFTRGSLNSRPSVESARSQASASSFEVTTGDYSGSRGALYDLARQSMSTSSFASSATSASAYTQNFAHATDHPKSPHYLPQGHDPSSRTTVSLDGVVSPAMALESIPMRHSSSEAPRIGYERGVKPALAPLSRERQSRDKFVHPYANPDLVPYVPPPETIPSHHPISEDMTESDSNVTVTDSASPRSAVFSVMSAETSTTSLNCRDIPHGNRRLNGREISSPISVLRQNDASYVDRSTRFLSLHPPPVGFEAPHRNIPTVTLISLHEAQERERFRSNTVHTTVTRQKPPFPDSDDISETTEEQTVEAEACGKMTHTRARSTSAGARQKTVQLVSVQSQGAEIRDGSAVSTPVSAGSGRSLKHKKSGFMRLFGGRNLEGEKERSPTPPFPPVIDVCAEESLQARGGMRPSKLTLQTAHDSEATLVSTHSSSDVKGPSPRRRQPPPLSIVTRPSVHNVPISASANPSTMGLSFSPVSLTVPQSAPPGNSDFPGLKLRPVSTSFSSHFADMVVEERRRDVHTPSSTASSNTALSPFTPVSIRRSDDVSSTVAEAPGEEQLIIKGLQDQLASAKKAWQQQIWDLHGQIRNLTSELEDLRAVDNQGYCEVCGRGEPRKRYASPSDEQQPRKTGVVNRPRARTGDAARFANGN